MVLTTRVCNVANKAGTVTVLCASLTVATSAARSTTIGVSFLAVQNEIIAGRSNYQNSVLLIL